MKTFAVGLLLSAVSVAPVLAADAGTAYLSLDYGEMNLGSPSTFGLSGTAVFSNPNVLRIGGGYNFTPHVAVEAGYSRVGDSTINSSGTFPILGTPLAATATETLKARSWQLAAVGSYPVSPQFDVFAKLGVTSNRLEYSCSGTAGGTAFSCPSTSASKNNVMYGLGLKFNINRSWGARVQYERYGNVNLGAATPAGGATSFTLSAISVGGVYTF